MTRQGFFPARLVILGILIAGLASVGCNTIRTTFLEQNDCGQVVKKNRHFKKGLPVMVEVPTHVDIKIIQTDYWKIKSDGNNPKKLVHLPEATSRSADIKDVFTEKMFLMDPKRPAEGTGQFEFGFNTDEAGGKQNGTLKSVKYKAIDNTLTTAAGLLSATVGLTGKKTSIGADNKKLVSNTRTIAYKRFPVGSEYEGEIETFIATYINGCAPGTCYESPKYAPKASN